MAEGYLITDLKNYSEAYPLVGASVTVEDKDGNVLYTLTTDESGKTEQVTLPTVDKELSLDENYTGHPYTDYTVKVHAPGYSDVIVHGVHIFDGELAMQPVSMIPIPEHLHQEPSKSAEEGEFQPEYSSPIVINIGPNAIESSDERIQVGITPDNPRQRVLPVVVIPSHITVHLGRPAAVAQRVRVPFLEYIKNVASHEIYPTWPENALRANIYAIITFTLNRVFTEWYRGRGYPFDITSSTAFDQFFVYGGTIFASISRIVDEIFNQYVKRPNQVAPFFTSYCNGTTATCGGLSQWGTVPLANQGLTPLQILRRFYPPDIYITETNIIAGLTESFPGEPVRPGDRGFDVQVMQTYLNRIRRNFPLIPTIPALETNEAIYGPVTQQAVMTFQQVFSLPQTGIIDRATWFRISQIFVAVARLAELDGEGHTLGIGTVPPNAILRQGSSGRNVVMLQYILDFLTQFHPVITPIRKDGNFGPGTAQSVRDFQGMMGLTQDGVVGPLTWRALYDAYWGARNAGAGRPPVTPPQPPPPPPPTGTFNYTVVSGDTLWLLSQRFGTTVDIIRQLNNLTSDALSIGQVLRIPGSGGTTPPPPPPTGTFNYTVVSGDTLWLLSQRFGTTVDTIRQLNNLTSDALSIGQVLRIPGSGGTTPPPPMGSFNYTVRSGDTLWILAQRFGTTDSAIRALNGLTSNNLSIGQVLRIPGNVIQYTVVAGDNLWILSQRFGVPGDRIRAFNNLPNNNLSIGQVLLIPQ